MKIIASMVPLTLALVLSLPSEAAAQCETPESCSNEGGSQWCGAPGGDSWDYEDCHVSAEGFCQLSGRCDGQTFLGGMGSSAYAALSADRTVTPAGTYAPMVTPVMVPSGALKTCTGFVISSDEAALQRPDRILLEG